MIDFTKPPNLVKTDMLLLPRQDQDYQVALWMATTEVLQDMRKRPEPSPPSRVVEYQRFAPSVKTTMNKSPDDYKSFWNDPEVASYFDQRQNLRNLNWRNLKELKWAESVLTDRPELAFQIRNLINQYEEPEHPEPIGYKKDMASRVRPDAAWMD